MQAEAPHPGYIAEDYLFARLEREAGPEVDEKTGLPKLPAGYFFAVKRWPHAKLSGFDLCVQIRKRMLLGSRIVHLRLADRDRWSVEAAARAAFEDFAEAGLR